MRRSILKFKIASLRSTIAASTLDTKVLRVLSFFLRPESIDTQGLKSAGIHCFIYGFLPLHCHPHLTPKNRFSIVSYRFRRHKISPGQRSNSLLRGLFYMYLFLVDYKRVCIEQLFEEGDNSAEEVALDSNFFSFGFAES